MKQPIPWEVIEIYDYIKDDYIQVYFVSNIKWMFLVTENKNLFDKKISKKNEVGLIWQQEPIIVNTIDRSWLRRRKLWK